MIEDAYYCPQWADGSDWPEDYSILKGPNGFECLLTESEDRTWYRDGGKVIDELNRLFSELEDAQDSLSDARHEISSLQDDIVSLENDIDDLNDLVNELESER